MHMLEYAHATRLLQRIRFAERRNATLRAHLEWADRLVERKAARERWQQAPCVHPWSEWGGAWQCVALPEAAEAARGMHGPSVVGSPARRLLMREPT